MEYFWCSDPQAAAAASPAEWKNEQIKLAKLALDNTFIFIDHYEMERCTREVHFDGEIDWNHVPFGDAEWNYAFNRHTFLIALAHAFAITGDEKYKRGWIRLFTSWCENTTLDDKTKNLSWRSLESGIRIENWLRSAEIFSHISPLDDNTLSLLSSVLKKHVEYLLSAHNAFHRLSNWGVLQDHGLFLAALYLCDRSVIEEAARRLDEEFFLQTDADGLHWEQSPMYQAEVLHAGLDVLLTAMRHKVILPERLVENVHAMAEGLAFISRPDGKLFLFGDSDELSVTDMFTEAAILFSDSTLAWAGKGRREAETLWDFPVDEAIPECIRPLKLSRHFPMSGNLVMRPDDEVSVRFHSGSIGSGHGHLDQLHFDLYLKGDVLLTDTGRYTYVDNEERRYLKGGRGHNTILVNGRDISRITDSWGVASVAESSALRYVSEGGFAFADASHLGYMDEGILVKRSLLLVDSKALVVADYVYAPENAAVSSDAFFHIDAGSSVSVNGNCIKVSKNNAKLTMVLPDEDFSLEKGIMSRHYNETEVSDVLVHHRRKSGVTLTLIVLDDVDFIAENIPVIKPLTGTVLPSDIASGLSLTIGHDTYRIAIVHQETCEGGFLLSLGSGSDFFGHVYARKNDEEGFTLLR